MWTNKYAYIYNTLLPNIVKKYQTKQSFSELYDKTCLFAKGLLLNTGIEIRKLILESGDSVIISRHGVPCLIVSKFTPEKTAEKPEPKKLRFEDTPLFGMWADREDMANPREWIEKMRSERMKRLFQ